MRDMIGLTDVLQATQVRKSSYGLGSAQGPAGGYHPETHHGCTIHAGTFVQQVFLSQALF